MTRRKREIIGLRNERDFPHLVELALPPEGFRSVLLEIDAFHRERRIPVRRGRSRHHLPYRGGGPAFNDLLGGQVQVMFPTTVGSIGYIRAGRLRALAVTTAMRSETLPDLPTMDSLLPGYEASVWYGIGVPKNTPAVIVEKLNKEINAALAGPKIKAQLADLGGTPLVGSPADFEKFIADETEKWGNVVKFVGIKAD